jgi:ABC-2 type transport system ATP-binding protein
MRGSAGPDSPPVIEASGLTKRFGSHLAVAGVDLAGGRGQVLGVLGPNGAGKSTTVRMLTTMIRPDGGSARIAGLDVVERAADVRRIIGVTGQDATLDELLTGRQNLAMVGELSRLTRREARTRAVELLDQFDLADAADRIVRSYSGGMRRRLDLAASLVARPPVLFLDEPTTGLDPTSRQAVWQVIRGLVDDGTTVLLTTQYLDEADELADSIVVIDHGEVIAEGTGTELKQRTGGVRVELVLSEPSGDAVSVLGALVSGAVEVRDGGRRLTASASTATGLATRVVRAFDGRGIGVDDLAVHPPSLDDVFFALTGTGASADPGATPDDEPNPALELMEA